NEDACISRNVRMSLIEAVRQTAGYGIERCGAVESLAVKNAGRSATHLKVLIRCTTRIRDRYRNTDRRAYVTCQVARLGRQDVDCVRRGCGVPRHRIRGRSQSRSEVDPIQLELDARHSHIV